MSDLTYLDIVLLRKLAHDPEPVIERFGGKINTSFFEAANMLGTLKVKGYVDLNPTIGGLSRITLTDDGKFVLNACEDKAKEPLDTLDDAILRALSSGIRNAETLAQRLNVRDSDLASHLSKLELTGFMSSEVSGGKLSIQLTEKGFNRVGGLPAVITGASIQPQKPASARPRPKQPLPQKKGDEAVKDILQAKEPEKGGPQDYTQDVEVARAISKSEFYLTKYSWVLILAVILLIIILYIIIMGA